ncbi:MAG: hypothetical protein FWC14_06125 [Candidatus Bathyarchaeota archaeon]|uniref:hypothetical protein n=1 Tax=Candidatus Bathycorpusculum sp. TaxID=2994959 RepID=UPI002835F958|nr:hypothetical protein [Candidatus Termiticorpusculum sp.]MCL2292118.1 hypothetical protein [Candidatus Termiticorpusculum sp.]
MYSSVEVLEERLCQFEQLTRKEVWGFRRYFKVDLALDGSFKFERDYEKIDGFDRDCGFFGLLTNTVLSSGEVLSVYRQRVVLEKGFDDLKNYLDMRRLRTCIQQQSLLSRVVECAIIIIASSDVVKIS